ncbi:hypothetical protein T01_2959 [Trichinella spiralis]|uniref:Uncharacterized protein n=1 Tax=Trichinella spiralis TaxID=6334 RepID=A0A0V1BVG0_TRISP|nr:hypothetical protein T01_2959 [Trichinella spiralis]
MLKQLVAEVSELVGCNCFALGSKRAIDRTVCRAISLIELLEGQKLLSPIGDGSSKTDQSPAPIN